MPKSGPHRSGHQGHDRGRAGIAERARHHDPRSQMVTIEKSQPVDEFLPVIIESGHPLPVINEDKDHVEGILLAMICCRFFGGHHASEPLQLEKILRPTVIVPESKRVDRLLKEFREERYHMAIVVDEFGGVSGP